MIHKLHKKAVCLLLALALLILPLGASVLAVPTDPEGQLQLLQEIDQYIANYFLESDGKTKLPKNLTAEDMDEELSRFYEELDKLVEGFDDYSAFFEKEIYDMFFGSPEEESQQELYGIGIMVDPYRTHGAYIFRLLPGGAAEAAGLLPRDQIVSVDGTDTRALPLEKVTEMLRGPQGTTVRVGVRRPGALEDEMHTVVRRALQPSNIAGYLLDSGEGYISISGFMGEDVDVRDFKLLMERFKEQGVTDVIIDLRDNGGGLVDEAYQILCLLGGTEGETLFSLVDRDGNLINRETDDGFYTYEKKSDWLPENLIILVNENTASASEIMAGSLQDRGLATLIGVQTYGKARAQIHFPMFSGDVLALTISSIELPVSGDYNGVGLAPDQVVELDVITLDTSVLTALDATRAILPGLSSSSRTLALEQRLNLLGYFLAEPDEVFDAYTLHALNCFQMTEELTVTSYGSVQSLELMEEYMTQVNGLEYVPVDNQLEYVLELLDSVG